MEVDRAGNIKAMGEDVKNVMVDGKEFFSSDPKVATKNLPADAINKVQVYDKKSEAAELAGIDDGSRDKTINLLLKDGKKQAWLGDVTAGAGTNERYAASAKVYRFTKSNQFAVLGMLNNINRFGFSFQDYIDFNGGLPAMMGSGSMRFSISSDDELPINFGQTVNGLVTSGAGGINYSFDLKKNNRIYASYMGSGTDRNLIQKGFTRNYLATGEFTEENQNDENSRNYSHRLNLGWKDKSDTTRTLMFNGSIGLTDSREDALSFSKAFRENDFIHQLESKAKMKRSGMSASSTFSAMKKGRGIFKLYRLGMNANFSKSLSDNDRLNLSQYAGIEVLYRDHQFRNKDLRSQEIGASLGSMVKIAKGLYFEPDVSASFEKNSLNRTQGLSGEEQSPVDSLSPDFSRSLLLVNPTARIRWNFSKMRIVPGLTVQIVDNKNVLSGDEGEQTTYARVLPSFSWEWDYSTGNRLSLDYNSSLSEPTLEFLLPVVDNSNPQSLFYGNRKLRPETRHEIFANWLLFDQFSQTSVFARVGGTYIVDKIGFSRWISDSLVQRIYLLNTDNERELNGNIDFTTPLKIIGMNLHLGLNGRWTSGLSFVNDEENKTNSFSRSVLLSLDNRKKEKWDLDIGAEISFTDAKYSLQSGLNNKYITLNYFAEFNYNPNDSWHFGMNADVINYSSGSYQKSVSIPLLGAEMSYSFLRNHRGILQLESNDLLNENKGLQRTSEMNYLREIRSNIIGRYVLLSFKYRLNKAAKARGGLEIEMKKR
ncbi:MAG: outer membrane beta-barrel protein [Bacteroidales bacterium]|nr:outer membrane beta-barrel protein [Bacteroidales bacterium]